MNLSERQQNMDDFVENVLRDASNKDGRYSKISDELSQQARRILDEYSKNPDDVTGAVIGVDLKKGEIRISRWRRE